MVIFSNTFKIRLSEYLNVFFMQRAVDQDRVAQIYLPERVLKKFMNLRECVTLALGQFCRLRQQMHPK